MRARDFTAKKRREFLLKTWPEALESGEHKQGTGQLIIVPDPGSRRAVRYCCLGVACKLLTAMGLLKEADWHGNGLLPDRAARLLHITCDGDYDGPSGSSLAIDNDDGQSFKRIAKTIRRVTEQGEWDR